MHHWKRLPPSIADLGKLQRACFQYIDPSPEIMWLSGLPVGPWASSLRSLGAPYDMLLLSSELLAAAGQLEQLAVLDGDFEAAPSEASARFWRWCAAHPPLRQLDVEVLEPVSPDATHLAALEELRTARPDLRVQERSLEDRYISSPEHPFPNGIPFSNAFRCYI